MLRLAADQPASQVQLLMPAWCAAAGSIRIAAHKYTQHKPEQ
jgi:hypothetical protein